MENYLVSARKYRPATFASVVGQKSLTATLKNAIATERLAHSYLFCGSRGVGKTSCARIFAKTINCEHLTPDGEACNECASCRAFNSGSSMNVIELDAASNNGVDAMHSLIEQTQVPPTLGRYRVFIVDEVHMLSQAAFNAFLKTLEEPPSYVIFILATTEKHKILATILSRCQIYDFNRISTQDMVEHLSHVASSEGFTAEPAALNVIARKADGAMRDALSIFDQVAASTRGNITYKATIDNLNVLDNAYYDRLLEAFISGKVLDSWLIYKEIRDKGFDSHFFLNGLTDYFRDLMVARDPAALQLLEASDDVKTAMAREASRCTPDFIYRAMCLCNDADLNYRVASNKQFLIEVTLAKICQSLSPSPGNDGQGEGRLKPIDKAVTPSQATTTPQAAPQETKPENPPRQTVPTPHPAAAITPAKAQSPTVAQPTSVASNPASKTRPTRNRLGPSLSLNASPTQPEQSSAKAVTTAQQPSRREPFNDERLYSLWQRFIKENPHQHILINTMRASMPVKKDGEIYTVTVENEMQRDLIQQSLPGILKAMRDGLENDFFTIEVHINTGDAAPHTWNERQVLEHLLRENPALQGFMTDLKLKL